MDFPQQREVLFLGNQFHAADEPQNATAFPAPQHPQPAPSFDRDRRPLPGQPHGHAGVLRDAVVSNWHRDIPPFTRAHTPPPVENIAAQQDLQYVDMGYYDMANDYPPPQGHRDHIIGDNARIDQDVPAQAHVAPPEPEMDAFIDEAQQAAAGPAPVFLEELPPGPQVPVPNGRATEVLRQLANLYLNDPNSQIAGISMEPGQADGVMVVISLRLTDL